MACGPATPRTSRTTSSEGETDIFGFEATAGLAAGMAGLALMWTTPWRAAMVLADEAVREFGND